MTAYPLIWYWRRHLPERKGQRCRVVLAGHRLNSVLVEFEDGTRVVTLKWAVRPYVSDDQLALA